MIYGNSFSLNQISNSYYFNKAAQLNRYPNHKLTLNYKLQLGKIIALVELAISADYNHGSYDRGCNIKLKYCLYVHDFHLRSLCDWRNIRYYNSI